MKQSYEITDSNKDNIKKLIIEKKVGFSFMSLIDCLEIESKIHPFFEDLQLISCKKSPIRYNVNVQVNSNLEEVKVWWEIKCANSYREYEVEGTYEKESDYPNQVERDIVNSLKKILQGDLDPKKN